MTWDDVLDQRRAVGVLRRAVARERVAHAYLFHGPDGVGKRAAALAFAQALECERPRDGEPCDQCLACTKVRRMLHPDVRVLFPYPKGTDEADLAERIQRLGRDPYAPIDYVRRPSLSDPTETSNKQVMYHIDRVHEDLLRPMSLRPVEGAYKVAILTDVERMRTEAANAFLKLLEEPPPQTVFVLTTSRPDRLLPTILSRCQQLRLEPLTADRIEAALMERDVVADERAAMLARMADGSFSRALTLAESRELLEGRQLVLRFFRQAYLRDPARLAEVTTEVQRLGRERTKGFMELMLRWLRDLILVRELGDEAPMVNVDQAGAARRFCRNVPEADLEAMVGLVEEAHALVERNVRVDLVAVTLAYALGRAMGGPHDGRLYVPLPEADLELVEEAGRGALPEPAGASAL